MTEFLFLGAGLGLAAGISPGPILTLVVAQTLRYGRREGIIVSFAPLISDLPIVALSLWVLSRLRDAGAAMAVVSIAGALFLLVLGIETLRAKPPSAGAPEGAPRSLAKAVAMNFLNPHVYLFWSTVGAPLVLKGWSGGAVQPAAFLAAFYACLIGSKVGVALLLGRMRGLLTGRAYVYTLRALAAALFILAGILFRDGWIRVQAL
ncbi:MAG: LysE family transporter [Bryobacteraceae bacterium]|nr:LysE family transporter [Bryobacteraceae bacterium]